MIIVIITAIAVIIVFGFAIIAVGFTNFNTVTKGVTSSTLPSISCAT